MKLNANHTIAACFIGFFTQALVINFPPLLFITFEQSFNISLGKISMLIAISFITQLIMDLLAANFPSFFNRRIILVAGMLCSALGLVGFAVLPNILPPYTALIISTSTASIGSGIIEVMGSPTVEACPTKSKSGTMSLLHSFYCWGLAATVALSTLFFFIFGLKNWQILACLWAIIPAVGAVAFSVVPLYRLESAPQSNENKSSVFRSSIFWAFVILMICAGAAEQAMSQWVSSFAEMGLGVSKAMGDLLGPCCFAILMGGARVFYAKFHDKINLSKFIVFSSALCIFAYLLAAFAPSSVISLVGCAICGFSVGIMWPGTYSLATRRIKHGGVKMFALLALAGDVGCTVGPTAAGWIADAFGDDFKVAFIFSAVFPIVMIIFTLVLVKSAKKGYNNESR